MIFDDYVKERQRLFDFQPTKKEMEVLIQASNSLGGEVGELQNVVKKIYRDHKGNSEAMRTELKEELGGVFWYLLFFCKIANITPEEVFGFNIKQLKERYSILD